MGLRIFVGADRPREQIAASLTFSLFGSFVGQRPVFYLKCFPHKLRADIGSGETSSVTNSNLYRLHRLKHRSIVFAAMIERPHILTNFRMQGVFWNYSPTQCTTRFWRLGELSSSSA